MYVNKVVPWKSSNFEIPERHQDWIADENPYGRKSQGTIHAENA
jgi:hypothetical protein